MTPARRTKVVLVDDEPTQTLILTNTLERTGRFETHAYTRPVEALEAILADQPDAVVTDLMMPEMSGYELVRRARAEYPSLPLIVLTGLSDDDSVKEAFDAGATDFVTKPTDPRNLIARLDRALARVPEEELLLKAVEDRGHPSAILGDHPRVRAVRESIRHLASVPGAPVLLLGESGTGKTLVAHAIHNAGDRAGRRFVEVNCAALPDNLIEAELFGYEKGAFTDASRPKRGLAEVADGGTLFLDEVGTLPLALQAKLLTFLESRTFRRLGGTEDISVNLHLIAATNADLEEEVREGRFREDLYFRLAVATLRLPALRQIPDDIGPLARHFLARAARDFGKPAPLLTDDTVRRLERYPWPGNARELRNAVERALIFTTGGILDIEPPTAAVGPVSETARGTSGIPLGLTLDEVERRYIEATLAACDGNVAEAADALGVTRKVLWSRRKKHGLL